MTTSGLGYAYIGRETALFPQNPPIAFEPGVPKQVAFLKAASPQGYSSTIFETRMPARSYEAKVVAADGTTFLVSTGTGSNVGRVFRQFCEALQAGDAKLTCQNATPTGWWTAEPLKGSDGRPVSMQTIGVDTILHLPGVKAFTGRKKPVSVSVHRFARPTLAEALSRHVLEGNLDIL